MVFFNSGKRQKISLKVKVYTKNKYDHIIPNAGVYCTLGCFLFRQNDFPSCYRVLVVVLTLETQEKQKKFKSRDYITP